MSRRNAISLTPDERMLINMNMRQYDQITSQIEQLHETLNRIRNDINDIYQGRMQFQGQTEAETDPEIETHGRNVYRNRYRNVGDTLNRMRDRMSYTYAYSPVFYDYNNPINPSLYTNTPSDGFALRNLVNRLFDDISLPTRTQINNASREIVYNQIQNPITEVCPISLNRFQPTDVVRQIHYCGHIFGLTDFNTWFSRSCLCPVCRYDIRNYVAQSGNRTTTATMQNVQVAPGIPEQDTSDTETESDYETDDGETKTQDDFSNVNVTRDRNNNVSEVSFDISNNRMTNNILSNLTQNLIQSVLYGQSSQNNNLYNYRLGDQEFLYDASNNVLMYETIIRPSTTTNNQWRRNWF